LPFVAGWRQQTGLHACDRRRRQRVNPSSDTREMVTALETLARKLAGQAPDGQGLAMPVRSRPEIDDPKMSDRDLTTILAMPLDQFASNGKLLEVRVPWLDVTLWFVPEERDAEVLVRDGVSRDGCGRRRS